MLCGTEAGSEFTRCRFYQSFIDFGIGSRRVPFAFFERGMHCSLKTFISIAVYIVLNPRVLGYVDRDVRGPSSGFLRKQGGAPKRRKPLC